MGRSVGRSAALSLVRIVGLRCRRHGYEAHSGLGHLLGGCQMQSDYAVGRIGWKDIQPRVRAWIAHAELAAIRGEGTSDAYFPPEVPALPSFKLHKFVSDKIVQCGYEYRTGVVYTTNRRLWEHDESFLNRLKQLTCIAIDMETATIFIAGHYDQIARGAVLLVSDVPITPEGVKTEESDTRVTGRWSEIHLQIGIEAMAEIGEKGEKIKHFRY